MEDKEQQNNLKVFGYGVALLIPYLFSMHVLKEMYAPSFGTFLLWLLPSFIMLLTVMNVAVSKHIVYLIVLIGLTVFDASFYMKHGITVTKAIFAIIAIVFYLLAALKVSLLQPVYDKWMVVAHFIGLVISSFILTFLYIIAFVPAGIVMRILGKDPLNQKIDPQAKSYWIERNEEFDRESCTRQF